MADKDQDPARVFAFSVRFEYVMEKERLGLRERERERERELTKSRKVLREMRIRWGSGK